MAVVLEQEGRTGYRRCVMQFLHDMHEKSTQDHTDLDVEEHELFASSSY